MRRCVLLFVKHPTPGKVKTRLAATCGAQRAASIYRALAERVLRRVPESEEVLVMCDPPEQVAEIESWLAGLECGHRMRFLAQARGDLGARLAQAFALAFAAGFEQVAAIGSDCVELGPEHLAEAWAALATQDAALGPAVDGGYYLLGLRAPQPELFRDIAWSTDAVCRETLARAAATGLRVHLLPTLRDVDTEEDWKRVEC
jgi:rSAM/selenodomain-associated transferase 1